MELYHKYVIKNLFMHLNNFQIVYNENFIHLLFKINNHFPNLVSAMLVMLVDLICTRETTHTHDTHRMLIFVHTHTHKHTNEKYMTMYIKKF